MLTRRGHVREGLAAWRCPRRSEDGQLGRDDEVANELRRVLQREAAERHPAPRAIARTQRRGANRADVFAQNAPFGERDLPDEAGVPEFRWRDGADADPFRQPAARLGALAGHEAHGAIFVLAIKEERLLHRAESPEQAEAREQDAVGPHARVVAAGPAKRFGPDDAV